MTGELNLGRNKIVVLRDPDNPKDAANKQYVDAGDTTVDNKLSTLQTNYEKHVEDFKNNRKYFQKLVKTAEEIFGEPRVVDMKLGDIKQTLDKVKTTLDDVKNGIPVITTQVSMIKIPAGVEPDNIINISYVVSSLNAMWSEQNNIIEYTATATVIYRLSVLSATKFKIFTRFVLLRHHDDINNNLSGVVSVVINKGTKETFTLEPEKEKGKEKTLTGTAYYYCLEFVAETPQLVTA